VARQDIENFHEIPVSENHRIYRNRFIQDETRGMDLHIGTIGIDGSALEVACPTPGIGAKF
jgi:hypothetical protein